MPPQVPTGVVVAALLLVYAAFACYTVLVSDALDQGLSPGVFVIIRDTACALVLLVTARVKHGKWSHPHERHQALFILLGAAGLYFGQYVNLIGIQHSDALLASLWANATPVVTYILGLFLQSERWAADGATALKLSGLALTVLGAVLATVYSSSSKSEMSSVLAGVCFSLQVVVGGGCFWHLQKRLMEDEPSYSSHQVAAWYYSYGLVLLLMVVMPNSMQSEDWALNNADVLALAVAVPIWPLCAFLLTFANQHTTPVMVMLFAPTQIVFTFLLEYLVHGESPTTLELAGAACVTIGIVGFVLGSFRESRVYALQAKDKNEPTTDATDVYTASGPLMDGSQETHVT